MTVIKIGVLIKITSAFNKLTSYVWNFNEIFSSSLNSKLCVICTEIRNWQNSHSKSKIENWILYKIEFDQIRCFEFVLANSKYQNSNGFEWIRPRLVATKKRTWQGAKWNMLTKFIIRIPYILNPKT